MGDVKSYQGSPVSVIEDIGDGTSLVAVLQEVASGDLLDWTPPSAAAAATPEPAPVDPRDAEIAALQAQIEADQQQIADDQTKLAELAAAQGEVQPPEAAGA